MGEPQRRQAAATAAQRRTGRGRLDAVKSRRERRLARLRTLAIVLGAFALVVVGYGLVKGTADYLDDPGSSSAATTPGATGTTAAPGPLSWTVAAAEDAVRRSSIGQVSGAPARIDRTRVTAALQGTGVRVLFLPFSGLDGREVYRDQVEQVATALLDQNLVADRKHLVVVEGLSVAVDFLDVVPSTRGGLVPVFARYDVTDPVISAIDHAADRADSTTDPAYPPAMQAADPAQAARIGDVLAADQVYTAPGVAPVAGLGSGGTSAGLTVRIAAFPAVTEGEPLVDYLTPLAARFPDDLVVVVHGLWVQTAGPDPDLQQSASLYLYGQFLDQLATWGPDPVPLAKTVAGRIGDLRSNRATARSPHEAADPVSATVRLAPWLFAGLAVLAGAASVVLSLRISGEKRLRRRAGRIARDRLVGRLTAVAARLTELDGLAVEGEAAESVDQAAERYGTARQLLDRHPEAAAGALDQAEAALTAAEAALAVPAAELPS